MKLTKETLKRIIKEELESVMSEATIKPSDIGGGITPEQQGKIDELIFTGNPKYVEQAREIIKAFGGNLGYVDEILEYMTDGIVPLAHSHEDVSDTFFSNKNPSHQDKVDFYNATYGQESDMRAAVDGKYSVTPEQGRSAMKKYSHVSNARRLARK